MVNAPSICVLSGYAQPENRCGPGYFRWLRAARGKEKGLHGQRNRQMERASDFLRPQEATATHWRRYAMRKKAGRRRSSTDWRGAGYPEIPAVFYISESDNPACQQDFYRGLKCSFFHFVVCFPCFDLQNRFRLYCRPEGYKDNPFFSFSIREGEKQMIIHRKEKVGMK